MIFSRRKTSCVRDSLRKQINSLSTAIQAATIRAALSTAVLSRRISLDGASLSTVLLSLISIAVQRICCFIHSFFRDSKVNNLAVLPWFCKQSLLGSMVPWFCGDVGQINNLGSVFSFLSFLVHIRSCQLIVLDIVPLTNRCMHGRYCYWWETSQWICQILTSNLL